MALNGAGSVELTAPNPFTGDTNVNSGTLRLSGAAAVTGSANIRVHPGAKLDVAGLSQGFELAGGQSLDNHQDGLVVGHVISTSGATIAGSGRFIGGVTIQGGAVLRVGGVGLPSAASINGQNRIDDFQSYAPGKLNAGVTGGAWTGVMASTDNAQVVSDVENKSLEYYGTGTAWRGALTSLRDSFSSADHSLADGEQATYFFRVQRRGTQTIDGIFGLTDLESIGVDAPGKSWPSPCRCSRVPAPATRPPCVLLMATAAATSS